MFTPTLATAADLLELELRREIAMARGLQRLVIQQASEWTRP